MSFSTHILAVVPAIVIGVVAGLAAAAVAVATLEAERLADQLDLPLERVRLEQAGADKIYGNVAMFVASLPFHPEASEGGAPPFTVRASEWLVAKVARELGINATGGSSSVADAWEPVRAAAATARAALLGAAAHGLDATPIEGFDSKVLDAELGLRERGFTSVVILSLGYRSEADFNAGLSKSRLPASQVFTFL